MPPGQSGALREDWAKRVGQNNVGQNLHDTTEIAQFQLCSPPLPSCQPCSGGSAASAPGPGRSSGPSVPSAGTWMKGQRCARRTGSISSPHHLLGVLEDVPGVRLEMAWKEDLLSALHPPCHRVRVRT